MNKNNLNRYGRIAFIPEQNMLVNMKYKSIYIS